MKLSKYRDFEDFLRHRSGCYEIGYARGDYFYPRYIGRASNIWNRVKTYMNPIRCHNSYILEKLSAERHNLWFRVLRTERYHGLEARHQAKHGVGDEGIYQWNKRVEWKYIGH